MGMTLWNRDGSGPQAPVLVAVGSFTMSGTTPLRRIGIWDGAAWSTLPAGGPGAFNGLRGVTAWDADGSGPGAPVLVVVETISGNNTCVFWSFDGTTWTQLGPVFESVTDIFTLDQDGSGPRPPTL